MYIITRKFIFLKGNSGICASKSALVIEPCLKIGPWNQRSKIVESVQEVITSYQEPLLIKFAYNSLYTLFHSA